MKQHYIPRCYLRRFSNNEKSIFAYDKETSKEYNASLMSVCFQNDLYTFSEDYVERTNATSEHRIDKFYLEHDYFAATIEPMFAKLLTEIDKIAEEWITGKEQYKLTYFEKKEIALHLVTQFYRMPEMQETSVGDYLRMEQASLDIIKHFMAHQTGNKEYEELEITTIAEKPALHAHLTYQDFESMKEIADAIANNIWIFQVSDSNCFYTSDYPIVVEPHVENVRPLYFGLAQYGAELTYPLLPNLMLTVFDRHFFKEKLQEDCSFVIATDKEIRRQNLMRYFYANKHVFSYNHDFSLITNFLCYNNGEHVFHSPNFRTQIISGLGKY